MVAVDAFKVEETIKEFTFREIGGIKILKEWRELAVICQIDIEIVSVSKENYRNYGSIPAHGFYGYASLVMRDFVSQPIKIQQSRQTIYYARNDSAISNWFTYLQQLRLQENFEGVENLICFNTGLLGGACVPRPCRPIPDFAFDEFPLREVMVKTFYGTQFRIEYSFWALAPELDNCGDLFRPKSKQIDGDKDTGLPPNGGAPQNGNPNNPYGGLPPADPSNKAGILSLSKLNNQDNSNPDNTPSSNEDIPATPTTAGYYIEYSYSSCSNLFNIVGAIIGTFNTFDPAYSDSSINVTSYVLVGDTPCANQDFYLAAFSIQSPTKGITVSRTTKLYGSINGSVKYGLLPTQSTFNGANYP